MEGQHYPVIEVAGSAYERGRQHGERARERVERSVELYRAAFARGARLDWPQALDRARAFARTIGALDRGIMAEMRGIADGAGLQVEEVVAINCRTELLFGAPAGSPARSEPPHECTTIAVAPEASASGATIVGKNWDWRAVCQESVIV